MKHSKIEGDQYANGPGAIDHQLAVFGVTRRRAGGHPTRASCTTHEGFCPLARERGFQTSRKVHLRGNPTRSDAARRQQTRTWQPTRTWHVMLSGLRPAH